MREIIFKAKRIDNGEWVEGSCVNVLNEHFYIFTGKLDISNGYLDFEKYSVNPETICQFTGLYDKNGNKIWENDIVKDLINGDVYSCEWNHGNCEYGLRNNKELFGLGYAALYNYQVIGNIFDNPELLKGGKRWED